MAVEKVRKWEPAANVAGEDEAIICPKRSYKDAPTAVAVGVFLAIRDTS